jgi:hypothetical protein
MYFETTMHTTRAVENAQTAAQLIKKREAYNFEALIWTGKGRRLAAVADNHCDNPWLEVAVIDMDRKCQIESITADWCRSTEELATHLATCETTDFVFRRNITLPLDNQNGDTLANFECGCCGSFFQSTYAKQRKYDQDDGYGICPDCDNYRG